MSSQEIPLFLGVLALALLFFFVLFRLEPNEIAIALELFVFICATVFLPVVLIKAFHHVFSKERAARPVNRHLTCILAVILQAVGIFAIVQVPQEAKFDMRGILFLVTVASTGVCYLALTGISLYRKNRNSA